MLQAWQIERCQVILDSDHATNFEVRMVAEIHLYWIVYEHLLEEPVDLLKSVAALQAWRRKWEFVLGMLSSIFFFFDIILTMSVLRATTAPILVDGISFL